MLGKINDYADEYAKKHPGYGMRARVPADDVLMNAMQSALAGWTDWLEALRREEAGRQMHRLNRRHHLLASPLPWRKRGPRGGEAERGRVRGRGAPRHSPLSRLAFAVVPARRPRP